MRVNDCGDSNCILRGDRGGMRTNGGCQHLRETGGAAKAQLIVMARELIALRRLEVAVRETYDDGRTDEELSALAELDALGAAHD